MDKWNVTNCLALKWCLTKICYTLILLRESSILPTQETIREHDYLNIYFDDYCTATVRFSAVCCAEWHDTKIVWAIKHLSAFLVSSLCFRILNWFSDEGHSVSCIWITFTCSRFEIASCFQIVLFNTVTITKATSIFNLSIWITLICWYHGNPVETSISFVHKHWYLVLIVYRYLSSYLSMSILQRTPPEKRYVRVQLLVQTVRNIQTGKNSAKTHSLADISSTSEWNERNFGSDRVQYTPVVIKSWWSTNLRVSLFWL